MGHECHESSRIGFFGWARRSALPHTFGLDFAPLDMADVGGLTGAGRRLGLRGCPHSWP